MSKWMATWFGPRIYSPHWLHRVQHYSNITLLWALHLIYPFASLFSLSRSENRKTSNTVIEFGWRYNDIVLPWPINTILPTLHHLDILWNCIDFLLPDRKASSVYSSLFTMLSMEKGSSVMSLMSCDIQTHFPFGWGRSLCKGYSQRLRVGTIVSSDLAECMSGSTWVTMTDIHV